MARYAEVTHIEMATHSQRRMKIEIHIQMGEDYDIHYGDFPLASDIPREAREALTKWLEAAND